MFLHPRGPNVANELNPRGPPGPAKLGLPQHLLAFGGDLARWLISMRRCDGQQMSRPARGASGCPSRALAPSVPTGTHSCLSTVLMSTTMSASPHSYNGAHTGPNFRHLGRMGQPATLRSSTLTPAARAGRRHGCCPDQRCAREKDTGGAVQIDRVTTNYTLVANLHEAKSCGRAPMPCGARIQRIVLIERLVLGRPLRTSHDAPARYTG
jgi:hypothetical protein